MFSKTAIALAAARSVLPRLRPAMANYAPYVENPASKGCPGEIKQNRATPSYRGAEHHTRSTTHHHG
jgi:hypothetical protein